MFDRQSFESSSQTVRTRPRIPDSKIYKTLTGEHICDHNAHCIDEVGDYRCECNLGYAGNGYQCMNIDECITSTYVCPPNAECVDTIASYECVCKDGYEASADQATLTCDDINECETGRHHCHEFAICENNQAGYYCYCKQGYKDKSKGDISGTECVEDNECRDPVTSLNICPGNSGQII